MHPLRDAKEIGRFFYRANHPYMDDNKHNENIYDIPLRRTHIVLAK